jgi:two-component system, OmpR family, alkaline phosphatase synthesis response regulator PhoP
MRGRVLYVEDEKALRMTVGDRLKTEGYSVEFASDGDEGFEKATQQPFDVIVLDIMLPKRSGLDLCRGIRDAGLITPILLLTARGQTADKVKGLKTGADDYVTKPFNMRELMARVEALMRRAPLRPVVKSQVCDFGAIHVDLTGTEATRQGRPINLSAREFQLLRYFIEHQGATLSRVDLLQQVWGYSADTFTRTVDVHVASLRQKLENDPKRPQYIQTVAGLGYRFRV